MKFISLSLLPLPLPSAVASVASPAVAPKRRRCARMWRIQRHSSTSPAAFPSDFPCLWPLTSRYHDYARQNPVVLLMRFRFPGGSQSQQRPFAAMDAGQRSRVENSSKLLCSIIPTAKILLSACAVCSNKKLGLFTVDCCRMDPSECSTPSSPIFASLVLFPPHAISFCFGRTRSHAMVARAGDRKKGFICLNALGSAGSRAHTPKSH